METNEHDELFE